MKKSIFLIIFIFSFSTHVFGQVKEISFEESHQELVTAFQKNFEGAWRIISKQEFFANGKPSMSNTSNQEYLNANKSRTITVSTKGKITERFEIINIDYVFYCRQNFAQWIKSENWCGGAGKFSVATNREEESAKYTVVETMSSNQKTKLYRQYIIYNDGKAQTYFDYKFWVREDGFILRREIEEGSLKPKTISRKLVETREYDVKNIKIEAPIK